MRRENIGRHQPPRENALANEPNPPRVTPPEPDSDEPPDEARLDEVSPPKKLLRDHNPPDEPWPPDQDPRGGHAAPVCRFVAMPGGFGAQFSRGISA